MFNNQYRVMVKMRNKYEAISVDDNGDILIGGSTNILYHSFFSEEQAIMVKDMLEAEGFDTIIKQYKSKEVVSND